MLTESKAADVGASITLVQVLLALLGSGGLITAVAAYRKAKVEGRVDGDRSTLDQMSKLNERLNADNLLLRQELKEIRVEVSLLRHRVTELEHALSEATK